MTYIKIVITIIAATQVIRISQNAISLIRQNVIFKKQLGDLAKFEPTVEDFDNQRHVYMMLRDKLERDYDDLR